MGAELIGKKSVEKVKKKNYSKQKSKGKSSYKKQSTSYTQYRSNPEYERQMNLAETGQPTYYDEYANARDALVKDLENSTSFKFDPVESGLYNNYAQDYRLLGNVAAAATQDVTEGLSGGYGTTYSGTVANQGLDTYLASEKDIIPQLYQQERQNYQQDIANKIQQGNLYNQLENQDFQQFLSELNQWNTNRDYYYNKWLDDYHANATQYDTESGTETTSETTKFKNKEIDKGTTTDTSIYKITPDARGGGRRGGGRGGRRSYGRTSTPKITKYAYKNYDNAITWLSNNGLGGYVGNVLSIEQFEQTMKNKRLANGKYTGNRKDLTEDYQDYLLNYLQESIGQEDTDYFTKKKKQIDKNMKNYYKKLRKS